MILGPCHLPKRTGICSSHLERNILYATLKATDFFCKRLPTGCSVLDQIKADDEEKNEPSLKDNLISKSCSSAATGHHFAAPLPASATVWPG